MLVIAKLILGLVSTFMVAKIAYDVSKSAKFDKAQCRASAVANSRGRLPGVEFENFDITCPTRYVTVDEELFTEESGGEINRELKIDCGKKGDANWRKCFVKKLNPLVANLMYDCWDQFSRGKISVFSKYTRNRQCLLCSRIEFSKKVKENFGLNPEDYLIKESTKITGEATSGGGVIKVGSGSAQELKPSTEPPEKIYEQDDLKLIPSGFMSQHVDHEDSLNEYLRNKNPLLHEISYYKFLEDKTDKYKLGGAHYDLHVGYDYALVFSALNEKAINELLGAGWDKGVGWITGSKRMRKVPFVNKFELIRYSEVVKFCDTLR